MFDKRVAILGSGSIALRYLIQLKELGFGEITVIDTSPKLKEKIEGHGAIFKTSNFCESDAKKYDLFIITSDPEQHLELAQPLIEFRKPFFIVSPLVSDWASLNRLKQAVYDYPTHITMVSCHLRFHPAFIRIREILQSGEMGKTLVSRLTKCSPGFSSTHGSSEKPYLELIHKADLARWLIGEFESVLCHTNNLCGLNEQDTDYISLIATHKNKSISEIHVNDFHCIHEQSSVFFCNSGSIRWNYENNFIELYHSQSKKWSTEELPQNFNKIETYDLEFKYFLDCYKDKKQTFNSLEMAVNVATLALSAKESSRTEKKIYIPNDTL